MEHVGIDLGSRNSHICVRNAEAEVVMETRVPTAELVSWLSGRERAQVVFETCCETFTVAEAVRCHGHDVRVVPSSVVRQLGVGYRGVKNDVRDARVLSRASVSLGEELPTVHIPSAESRRRQRLLTQRAALVRSRTILINGVKSQLRAELMKVGTGTAAKLPDRVRERLVDSEAELLSVLEPMLRAIDSTTASIKVVHEAIAQRTKNDPAVQNLKTMPGVGLLTAVAFASAIDDIRRFDSAAKLASYFGLTPGENTTGGKQRLTGVTRAGKAAVRTLLVQGAWTHVRVAPDSALSRWFQSTSQRRPKQVAIVGVARKMVHILFAMSKRQEGFDPSRGTEGQLARDAQRNAELCRALTATAAPTEQSGAVA